MSMPLENSRLCLDCDTVFDEPQCPSCGSESYFPLSRWVRPAREALEGTPARPQSKKVRNASLVVGGAGVAYALWRFLKAPDGKPNGKKNGSSD
jgi:hypothetical protein